jgi:hypothetical protein
MDKDFPVSIEETIAAIVVVRNIRLMTPMLALLFSGIDAMAYYAMPECDAAGKKKEDVTKSDFSSWVEDYMLKGQTFGFTAKEVYAARCAWVHRHGFEARLNREGTRKLLYSFDHDEADLQKKWDKEVKAGKTEPVVWVEIDHLISAFCRGARWSWEDIASDRHKLAVATGRLKTGMQGVLIANRASGQKRHSFLNHHDFDRRFNAARDAVRRTRKWLRGPAYDPPPAPWVAADVLS